MTRNLKTKYKVWLEIEKITDHDGPEEAFETLSAECVPCAEFDNLQDARDHIDTLLR